MKQFLFLIFALALFACKDDKVDQEPYFEIKWSSDTVRFNTGGGNTVIPVSTNQDIELEYTAEWFTATWNAKQNNIYITTETNKNSDPNTDQLTIHAGTFQKTLRIIQLGQTPALIPEQTSYRVSEDTSTLYIPVTANVPFTAEITFEDNEEEEWLTPIEQRDTLTNGDIRLAFHVAAYTALTPREATITLNGEKKQNAVITVTQSALDSVYSPSDPEDIGSDLKITVNAGRASSFQPGEGIELSFDGNTSTLYHSAYDNTQANYFPVDLEYFFTDAEQIDYLIYYPRSDGSKNGPIKEFRLYIKTEGDTDYKPYPETFNFNGKSSPSRITFTEPLIHPRAVKFHVLSGDGDGKGFVSCAEMEFYRKNPNNSIADIFTDASCSELKTGVTYEQICAMENEFYRNIAKYMFAGEYPKEFRIGSYKPYPYPSQDEDLKTNTFTLLDNPTGISVKSGEELVVLVGDTHGNELSVRVIDWNNGYGSSSDYMLTEGANKLKMNKSGLVYLMYHNNGTQPVNVHFATGKVNGFFDATRHSDTDYRKLINDAQDKHFDVLGKYIHMCFPVSKFRSACPEKGQRLVELYDSLVLLEHQLLGLYKYNRTQKNRISFVVDYEESTYMYATNYRTAYAPGTLDEILNPAKFRSTGIWGPAHEVGHVHQTGIGMKWIGMTEVTNNIMSLHVQTTFGNRSRQIEDDRYATGFRTLLCRDYPFCTSDGDGGNDVFVQLIPFWQLQLYNAKVLGKTGFYPDMYEQVRIDEATGTPADGEAQINFVRMACQKSGYNLLKFFERWGFLTPVDKTIDDYAQRQLKVTPEMIGQVKMEIEAMNLKTPLSIEYLRDDNIALYKNPQPVKTGSASLNGSTITLTGWSNIVAYEIYNTSTNGDRYLDQILLPSGQLKLNLINDKTEVYAIAADGEQTAVSW